MKSEITGIEFSNPNICIKGSGHFACICPLCSKEFQEKLKEFEKEFFGETNSKQVKD